MCLQIRYNLSLYKKTNITSLLHVFQYQCTCLNFPFINAKIIYFVMFSRNTYVTPQQKSELE
uniref:Uncharacterized protein n=1 Tax=Lepeophtheirus salmonis TaxID=72036 RepID=A0A0K2TPE1_LEPSM